MKYRISIEEVDYEDLGEGKPFSYKRIVDDVTEIVEFIENVNDTSNLHEDGTNEK